MKSEKQPEDIGWNLKNSYRSLPDKFFSSIKPIQVKSPKLVLLNRELAETIGLDSKKLSGSYGAEIFTGNKLPEGSEPLAQAYAGHQFGYFTMLGDGRAVLIGEQMTPEGKRVDIQLKGSGKTPYSRGGDGRATLGPMLREYIVSEAMHNLGVPTTRSLAVASTGETVIRENDLPGAILTRVSSSHIRVGTFEYVSRFGEEEDLKALADYTIDRHFPDVEAEQNRYLGLLRNVIELQAGLIARWQGIGFIHGVMNTDNMAISGETIDYGPCAFMDIYDPDTVFSSIDKYGRYSYGNQPDMASWNLARFAETLLSIVSEDREEAIQLCQREVSKFKELYRSEWLKIMRRKLGMYGEEPEDETIIKGLLTIMYRSKLDYTNTFRDLTVGKTENLEGESAEEFSAWKSEWEKRLQKQKESIKESRSLMKKSNPAVIPRNHCVEDALDAAVEDGDFSLTESLIRVLSDPYNYFIDHSAYYTEPKEWDRPYRTFCGT